jgi:(p)ppGpp synthase/HD superfamily hydrolase
MDEESAEKLLVKTIEFAKQQYADSTTALGDNLYAHCVAVARQAEVIAQRLYQNVRNDYMPDSTKESIQAIVQSAILHDVLNISACAFEHIAEIATVQVAAMVADISRDFRLVETKRDLEFRGRLSQSPIGAQIVIAADVICTAKELLRFLGENGVSGTAKAKKILAQLDGDLLALHATNRYYILRLYAHAARNLLGDVSRTIKECRQRAKTEKMLAQHTKKLQSKMAAKKAIDKCAAPNGRTVKKKGDTNGK